ncbi:MAG: response regulator transcription factor [Sediminispirochaetaceae bacterium]
MAHVLVVDDEVYIRELIKKTLAPQGHNVVEASNGHEAIKTLGTHAVDIAIVDLVMPEKGGLETLMEIRDFNHRIKLIAISGKIQTGGDSIKGLAQQFQIDAVLAKPFDVDELIQLVQDMS